MMFKHKQRGMSLISVMIGLTISLIVSMTILSLYRQSSVSSNTSTESSLKMTSMSTALITASNALQKAGYFVDVGSPTDINNNLVLLSNAQINNGTINGNVVQTPTAIGQTSVSGNALIWAWKDELNAPVQCSGLIMQNQQLFILQPTACNNALDYSALNWSNYELVKKGLDNTSSIVASFNSCAIFSYGVKTNSPTIALNLLFKPVESNSTMKTLTANICLQNLAYENE